MLQMQSILQQEVENGGGLGGRAKPKGLLALDRTLSAFIVDWSA